MKQITEGKVYKSIEKYVGNEKKLFIIYPYGNRGKMVEQILRETYNIQNCVLADNQPTKENILSVNQLSDLQGDYVLLLCSDNPRIYQEIRVNLKDKFYGEICDLAEVDDDEVVYEPFYFKNYKMQIEEVNSEQIKQVFARTKRAWEKLGKEEPYFSVITHDEMKTENLTEEVISRFFQSGNLKTIEIISSLKRNGVSNLERLSVLELGCGCGRITKSLARNFGHVDAVDISEGNLRIAREHIKDTNVDFFLMKEVEDYLKLPQADIIYSFIVLQHNCPPVIEYILNVMMNKVNPNGILMFQVPTYYWGYTFCYEEYMSQPEGMEMHCFPQNRIFELAYENQCIPLEVYPYLCTGRQDHSMMFIFRKK